jgi:hypothetical protein
VESKRVVHGMQRSLQCCAVLRWPQTTTEEEEEKASEGFLSHMRSEEIAELGLSSEPVNFSEGGQMCGIERTATNERTTCK